MKYRIVECYDGFFDIHVRVIKTVGILWWKRTVEEWSDIDFWGQPLFFKPLYGGMVLSNHTFRNKMKNSLESTIDNVREFGVTECEIMMK